MSVPTSKQVHLCFQESSLHVGEKLGKRALNEITELSHLCFTYIVIDLSNITFPCHEQEFYDLAYCGKFILLPGN